MNRTLVTLLAAAAFLPASAHALACGLSQHKRQQSIVSCRAHVSMRECRALAEKIGCSVVRTLDSINAVVITLPDDAHESSSVKLQALVQVERVEPDRKLNWLKSSMGFNPPLIKDIIQPFKRSSLELPIPGEAESEQPWGVQRVNAAAAWPNTMGVGVKVAVIDTGIDFEHPELSAAMAGGFNAVDVDKPEAFKDDQGHGTHVAGTIAAARDGMGVVGVAPQAKLYAVKVLDAEGNGTFSSVIAGIEWCVKNGIQVANMSLGASEGSQALSEAVAAAAEAGLVIVAAAGNDYGGAVSFPGAYPQVITVSSSDKKDRLSVFSSVGPEVDVIAPGSDVKSSRMGGGFVELSGTSMATPHAAGLAALAVAKGARGVEAVKAALTAAASPLPGLSAPQQGRGMVDAGRLVQ
jgi:subtilisin family serine protease